MVYSICALQNLKTNSRHSSEQKLLKEKSCLKGWIRIFQSDCCNVACIQLTLCDFEPKIKLFVICFT